MVLVPRLKIYMPYSKLLDLHYEQLQEHEQKSEVGETPLWTYVKGERINLKILFESILLNDSIKHISLLRYLVSKYKEQGEE